MVDTRSDTHRPCEEFNTTSRRRNAVVTSTMYRTTTRPHRTRPSTHSMRTRSEASTFRFFDLPAEVRNIIYRLAFEGPPTALSKLRLPRSLRVPQILGEARPFVFEGTPITVVTLSNWCVRYSHLHTAKHIDFESTGQVKWPQVVKSQPDGLVRFHNVTIDGSCCCCKGSRAIVRVRIEVLSGSEEAAGKLKAKVTSREVVNRAGTYDPVLVGLDKMLSIAEECVQKMDGRKDFNGLTVNDVENLAMCFRDESDDDGVHYSDSE